MDEGIQDLVSGLHASPFRCVIAAAGAGSQALSWLLGEPGASRSVLEATVPYSEAALADLLGGNPESAASAQTAALLADAAYLRALELSGGEQPVAGIACSAALVTDRPRKGADRAYVAARTADGLTSMGVVMDRGRRDRVGEELLASTLVLRVAALAVGVEGRSSLGLSPTERLEISAGPEIGEDPLDLLREGAVDWVRVGDKGEMGCESGMARAMLPGSFNPLHRAHTELARVAGSFLDCEVDLELSISNVDKPTLTRGQVLDRLKPLEGRYPVVVTRAERFEAKAGLFPGTTFVIGFDTAVRVLDPVYHGGDPNGPLRALGQVREAGCRFLVGGRLVAGVFRGLSDLQIPAGLENLFDPIPESDFRLDLSSTDMRSGVERAAL